MPVAHLTDISVSRLRTPGTYFDDTTPAFGIRVGKHRKTWIVMRSAERIRTSIGHYPTVSLADARKKAKALLTEAPTKIDRITFDVAYDVYKRESLKTKKPRTQDDYQRVLEKQLGPKIGRKRLSEISYEDVAAIADGLSKSEKRHCLAVGRTFFRWCVRPPRRYIPHSPLEGVQLLAPGKRKHILEDEELRRLWHGAASQGYPHGTIVQLLMLRGQRRGEIANLRWPWITRRSG